MSWVAQEGFEVPDFSSAVMGKSILRRISAASLCAGFYGATEPWGVSVQLQVVGAASCMALNVCAVVTVHNHSYSSSGALSLTLNSTLEWLLFPLAH